MMENQILCILKKHNKKNIELKEIASTIEASGIKIRTTPELKKEFIYSMQNLIKKETLVPLKNARPLLDYDKMAAKYQICLKLHDTQTNTLPSSEIDPYHPKMDMGYYAKHPDEYYENKIYIQKIDSLLKQDSCPILTANERSYLIFNDEKALTDPGKATIDGLVILRKLGNLKIEDLKAKETFEPFFCYQTEMFENIANSRPRRVLIIENKDTFWTLVDAIKSKRLCNIHLLIFGEGMAITKKFAFIQYLRGLPSDQYYYFGDIDYAGIIIYNTLRENFPEYDIVPAVPFYEYMLHIVGIENSRSLKSTKNIDPSNLSPFIDYFDAESVDIIREIVENKRCIPQEAINNNNIEEWSTFVLQ
jgi:hypothetical protein